MMAGLFFEKIIMVQVQKLCLVIATAFIKMYNIFNIERYLWKLVVICV